MLNCMLRFPVVAFATGFILLSCVPSARAQSEAPVIDPHLDEEARQVYLAGVAAYDAGRYEAALEYFSRAYALTGRPLLLFNIGSVTERLRRDDESLEAYEAYLDAIPDAPNRAFVESRIMFLREQLSERRRREQEVSRVEPRERDIEGPTPVTRPIPEERAAVRVVAPENIEAPRVIANEDESSGEITREWWFWTLIGVAVVGAGIGIGVAALDSNSGHPNESSGGDFGPDGVIVALGEW